MKGKMIYKAPREHWCPLPINWFGRLNRGDKWECYCGQRYEWCSPPWGDACWVKF